MKSYSQFGEDLFLLDFFNKTNLNKGYFFEFGAWDGIYLSNCRLFYEQGWSGCFVEADKKKFLDLQKNYADKPKIKLLNEFINTTNNTLNNITKRNQIDKIDLLSVDIDSKDLSVWKTLNNLKPKFVIIEYNKFIPFDVEFEDTTNQFIGNSILSIYKYAISQGYNFVMSTTANLIFVDKSFNNGRIKSINIADVYDSLKPLRVGYSWKGEMLFFENSKLEIKEYFRNPLNKSFITFQPIPKFLRKMSNIDGTGAKKLKIIYSHIILLVLRPNLFFLKIKNKIEDLIGNKKLKK
tara:strand:- start:168 stop:1049 length:882 start_codon:yes stop_codon:yes gene_type:complete